MYKPKFSNDNKRVIPSNNTVGHWLPTVSTLQCVFGSKCLLAEQLVLNSGFRPFK